MNRTFAMWMCVCVALFGLTTVAGCGGGVTVDDPKGTDAVDTNGDTTTDTTDTDSDGTDGTDGTDGMDGTDGTTDGTDGTDGTTDGTDGTDTVVQADEAEVIALLAEGLEADEAEFGDDTATDEDPFFGEDAVLYEAPELAATSDIELSSILDSTTRDAAGAAEPVGHGFVGGFHDANGKFRGRWFDSDEMPSGAVRGEWTLLEEGAGIEGNLLVGRFQAKYVDDSGRFSGFLRGRWAAPAAGNGFFVGRWFDGNNQFLGVLRGNWQDPQNPQDDGEFVGRWAALDICDEANEVPSAVQDTVDLADLEDIFTGLNIDLPDVQFSEREAVEDLGDVRAQDGAPCVNTSQPYGFLVGTHNDGTDSTPGTFEGRWVGPDGDVLGSVHGVTGTRSVIKSGLATEETITIEPDDFSDGEDLTRASDKVTLTTTTSDGGTVSIFEITASDDGFGYAPTGSKVFGHSDIPFFNTNRRLRMDFTSFASMVQISFAGGSSGSPETGRLQVYDQNNNLLEEYVTSPKSAGEAEVMTITRPTADIQWATAYLEDDEGSFGRLDALTFTVTTGNGDPDGANPTPILVGDIHDESGGVIGYIRGHYGVSDRNLGVFRGLYFDLNMDSNGSIKGRWHVPVEGRGAAVFEGTWSGQDLTASE